MSKKERKNYRKFPSHNLQVVSSETCDDDIKHIVDNVKKEKYFTLDIIKKVVVATEVKFSKFYYLQKNKQSSLFLFCRCWREPICCNVQIVFNFPKQTILIYGGNHSTVEVGQLICFKIDKKTLRKDFVENNQINVDSKSAKELQKLYQQSHPYFSLKDMSVIKNERKNLSFINYLSVLKETNPEMIVDYEYSLETIEEVTSKRKYERKKDLMGPVMSKNDLEQIFSTGFESDVIFDERNYGTQIIREQITKTKEVQIVDKFRIYFPTFKKMNSNIPILFMDGTFHKCYAMVILTIVSVDIMGKSTLIGFGGVSSESENNWNYVLEPIKEVLKTNRYTVITDRGSGLISWFNINSLLSKQSYCVFHLFSNFIEWASKECTCNLKDVRDDCFNLFVKMTTSISIPSYEQTKSNIVKLLNTNCEDSQLGIKFDKWISEREPEKWIFVKMNNDIISRFGYCCSSIVESYNSKISSCRKKEMVSMVDEIINGEIDIQINSCSNLITLTYAQELQQIIQTTILISNWKCESKGNQIKITTSTNETYYCSVSPLFCSCGAPADRLYPCSHIIYYCYKTKIAPFNLIPSFYEIQSYKTFHSTPINKPNLSLITSSENEKIAFKKRISKSQRMKSTFKDSSCIRKWCNTKDN